MSRSWCEQKNRRIAACVGTASIAFLLLSAGYGAEGVAYPAAYREWIHVKSGLVTSAQPALQSERGLHHIYANSKATAGYRSGEFPDGSIIVYELLETQGEDGIMTEGSRRRLDVMVKDATRYANTGGWGFQRFIGSTKSVGALNEAGQSTCFECHSSAKVHGFVFSHIR
jgi:hypothetical protein